MSITNPAELMLNNIARLKAYHIDTSIVEDNKNSNNDEVFVFNGWTFSSSPSIQVFDHPVYDLWILKCY